VRKSTNEMREISVRYKKDLILDQNYSRLNRYSNVSNVGFLGQLELHRTVAGRDRYPTTIVVESQSSLIPSSANWVNIHWFVGDNRFPVEPKISVRIAFYTRR
jgi:hypothetical protein